MNVFIADDSVLLQERLSNMLLEIEGVAITGMATDANNAFIEISKKLPDLAIIDISMPGGGGIQLLKKIKQYHPSIKVAVLTNYPIDKYREVCNTEGAEYFFSKSKEIDSLLKVIEYLNKKSIANN